MKYLFLLFFVAISFVGCVSEDFYIKDKNYDVTSIKPGEKKSLGLFHVSLLKGKQDNKAIEYQFDAAQITFAIDCQGNEPWQSPLNDVNLSLNSNFRPVGNVSLIDYKENEFIYSVRFWPGGTVFGPAGMDFNITSNIDADFKGSLRVRIIEIIGRKARDKKENLYTVNHTTEWLTVSNK